MSKNAVAILLLAASVLGFEVSEEQALEILTAITTLISFGLMIWNQVDRKDIKWFFWKK